MKARAALGALLAVGVLVPLIASAHHVDVPDANDTRGPLDLREVKTWGGFERAGWRLVTFGKWGAERIWDRGFLLVHLDTFGRPRNDYYVLIASNGSRLRGTLWRDRANRPDFIVRRVPVWRKNRRSVAFPLDITSLRIGKQRLRYNWTAQTLWTGPRCRRVCIDVLNRGAIVEPLGPSEPTPTISPTPTVSPSASPTASPTP